MLHRMGPVAHTFTGSGHIAHAGQASIASTTASLPRLTRVWQWPLPIDLHGELLHPGGAHLTPTISLQRRELGEELSQRSVVAGVVLAHQAVCRMWIWRRRLCCSARVG